MSKLSKKDEKIIQRFEKVIQQNTESVNHILASLQPLISDIKRAGQFELNFSYVILADPFFDFDVIGNILHSNFQSMPIVEISLNTDLVAKNNIQDYFNTIVKKINENNNIKFDSMPSPSGYRGFQFLVINRYEPESSITRFQSTNADIKQLANLFDEIIRLLFSPNFKNFGIILLLPERLEEIYYKTFQEWEQFRKIKISTDNRYREEACKKIIAEFSEIEGVPSVKNLENIEIISIINQAFDNIGFNPEKFLSSLKEKLKLTTPKPVTKKDIQFITELLPILASSDKTRHAKLKSILMELKQTNFDVRNILIELIGNQMQEIEKSFDSELKDKFMNESLSLIGQYPNYSININEFGINIKIDVKSPYGNIYVDEEALENKYPSGIVETIKNKIGPLKKLQPKCLTDNELIDIFVGYLTMYKGADKEIIDINEFLIGVRNFLNSKGIYPISVDRKYRDIDYLKIEFAKAPVVDALKKYGTFETGKITADRGIQLSGLGDKLYTIMKLQRDDRNG